MKNNRGGRRWDEDWAASNDKNPPSCMQLVQKCKNIPICLSHPFLMYSLEEVAEKSFPPNGLLGYLCTVSWWLEPTSSKTKNYVAKTPSQLTLIGIAVGSELWKQVCLGTQWANNGACGTKGGLFFKLCSWIHILWFSLFEPCSGNVYHLQHCYLSWGGEGGGQDSLKAPLLSTVSLVVIHTFHNTYQEFQLLSLSSEKFLLCN